ncbi:uncharacterized protein [Triticum aestivum]|uniref:uncharacterized protein n=1 Tax=Triticum aestivum TaxID=4565 RepID=UPI001D01B9DA|nr:uncharacterized protein LOC123065734 [Triticum aestivum]
MATAAGSEDGGAATTPVRPDGEQLLLLSAEGVGRSTVPSSPDDPAPKPLHYGVPTRASTPFSAPTPGSPSNSMAGSKGLPDVVLGEVEDAAYCLPPRVYPATTHWQEAPATPLDLHHVAVTGRRCSLPSGTTTANGSIAAFVNLLVRCL